MAVENVNTQNELVTKYIYIFETIIKLNQVTLVKRRIKHSKQIQANKILNQGIYIIECN
jgi:hypothetical protein